MQAHGLRVVYYQLDSHLAANEQDFIDQLRLHQPQLVVIFHPVGITSNLRRYPDRWLPFLPQDSLLIEDCVHRVINYEQLDKKHFLCQRHVLIDSLRKVVPIQGSYLYSLETVPAPSWQQHLVTTPYRVGVFFWWVVMQVFLLMAHYSPWYNLELLTNLLAERAMLCGYILIGKNYIAAPGFSLLSKLTQRLNHFAITHIKVHQYLLYEQILCSHLRRTKQVLLPNITTDDYGRLRAYPLVMTDLTLAADFLKHCRRHGVLLRYELNDGPWSQTQKVFYLPMGLHVSDQAIERIIAVVVQFFAPPAQQTPA